MSSTDTRDSTPAGPSTGQVIYAVFWAVVLIGMIVFAVVEATGPGSDELAATAPATAPAATDGTQPVTHEEGAPAAVPEMSQSGSPEGTAVEATGN